MASKSNSLETCTININDGSSSKMPKRPLTAYNLYYKYKRSKILEASNTGSFAGKGDVRQLVHATPGLENYPSSMRSAIAPDQLDQIRRNIIRLALEHQLFASDNNKKRKHKKSSGGCTLSFTEMNTVMVESWKKSDCFTKAIFKELAEDGKREYHFQLEAYYANKTSYIMPAVVNPEPKTPVAVCSFPCNATSNIKETLQGLDMDLMAPIPFASLPFASLPFIGDQKQSIPSSAPNNITSSNIRAEVPSPSSPMSSVASTNGTFKLHEVSPDTSQVRSSNGGNFFGNVSCRFAESAYPQGLLPRRVAYNTSGQYQNTVAYNNEMSTQDYNMTRNNEFDDDFMDMINKTLKY